MSMFGHVKHHTLGHVASLIILIVELIATQFVILLDDKASYVLCSLCTVLSMLWYEHTRAEIAAHYVVMTAVTWYQAYFIIEHMHADWWIETLMMIAVGVIYAIDYYLTTLKSIEASCPHDLREGYGYVAGSIFIALAFVPLHDAGLFALKEPLYLVSFLTVWPLLAYTESQRRLARGLEICLPHSAFKCLPMFFLSHHHWLSFALIIMINLLNPPTSAKHAAEREENGGEDREEEEESVMRIVKQGSIIQRFGGNGVAHNYNKEPAANDNGHVDVEVEAYKQQEDKIEDESKIHDGE